MVKGIFIIITIICVVYFIIVVLKWVKEKEFNWIKQPLKSW